MDKLNELIRSLEVDARLWGAHDKDWWFISKLREIQKELELTVKITGFKTKEEALRWMSAYEGGVEQDMEVWAEENPFPHITEMKDYRENRENLILRLVHPDTYKEQERQEAALNFFPDWDNQDK